jgi:DNA-binding IclR family transcriptional regulator
MAAGGPKDSPSISVERALAVLEAVAQRAEGMSNSDISHRLKIPKSSASYILRVLEHGGYLRRGRDDGRYHIGLAVVSLSHRALATLDIREIALPVLRQLVESSGFTAHCAILDNGRAVYVEKVEAPGFVKMDTWLGRRMDVHSTSVGKALVAHLPDAEIQALVADRNMNRYTPQTITTLPKLLRELEKVREQGYAIDDEENNLGVRCVAAPVFNRDGRVEASVAVSGIVSQLDRAAVPRIADLVKAAARKLSHQLGYAPPRRTLSA